MFEYIKGKLAEIYPTIAIIDVNGIGYKIFIPLSAYSQMPQVGSTIQLYTSFIVKEDSQTLYGFLTKEDKDLFTKLISVSGIGAKTAISILGHLDFFSLQQAISSANVKLISKVPGIGKKTAERLIIELRDKLKINKSDIFPSLSSNENNNTVSDAISALINLGYSPLQAQKAIKTALEGFEKEPEIGSLISTALKRI